MDESNPARVAGRRPTGARLLGLGIGLAVVLRLALFPFADNKQGDSPMRALLAERMNGDPAAARDARSFCQFGPLHIEVMRPFMAVVPDARLSSRLPSLLAGLAVLVPFVALARRMVPASPFAVALAVLALALSPSHLQASTTAASEALYLLLLTAALERLHAAVTERRRAWFALAGLLASLAAVTRFDS